MYFCVPVYNLFTLHNVLVSQTGRGFLFSFKKIFLAVPALHFMGALVTGTLMQY